MINFRQSDLPIHYEPVIVDHHSIMDNHTGKTKCPAINVKQLFDEKMFQAGYVVYGISHISLNHIQVVYLSEEKHNQAKQDFLRSDQSSIGSFIPGKGKSV
jgi:hypothetical protein